MKKEVIVTDVDRLLDLIKKEKRISFKNISKKLNLSLKLIEEWVTVLEDEGFVKIDYTFTTPYIIYVSDKVINSFENIKKEKTYEETIEFAKSKTKKNNKNDIDVLITLIRKKISDNKPEEAQDIYFKIKEKLNELPDKYYSIRREIESKILDLNKEIDLKLDEKYVNEVDKVKTKIEKIIIEIKKALKEKNIRIANEQYLNAKKELKKLPDGFLNVEIKLEKELLLKYKELLNLSSNLDQKDLDKYTKIIHDSINKTNKLTDIDEKINEFEKAEIALLEIPDEFLKQKHELFVKVSEYKQKLNIERMEFAKKEIENKKAQILDLIKKSNELLSKEELYGAIDNHNHAKKILLSLPTGFIETKIQIEHKLLDNYEKILNRKKEIIDNDFHSKERKINHIIKAINKYLKKDELSIAYEAYYEIVNIYNKLPDGFKSNKADLKLNMSKLYGEIIKKTDYPFLNILDEYGKKNYFEIIKLIVNTHIMVEENNFSVVLENYKLMHTLYNKLPIGFVEKNIAIRNEVIKIYHLYEIYESLELMKNSPEDKINDLKYKIDKLYNKILSEGGEHKAFLDYVKDKIMYYVTKQIKDPIKLRNKINELKTDMAIIENMTQNEVKLGDVASRNKLILAKHNFEKNNLKEALKEVGDVLKIQPENKNAKELLDNIKKKVRG